jgi:CBS domain-containing protein
VLVKEVLKRKGRDIFSVSPDTTVQKALDLMARKDVGAVLVMRGEFLVGVFSERDFAREAAAAGLSSMDWVYAVSPKDDLETCLALMNECHIRHLPVVEGEKVVGVISIGDLVKETLPDKVKDINVGGYIFVRSD